MPKKFRKSTVLRVGTHHSPDGAVDVTTDRLKHWESEFGRMKAAGQVVPMHWDHSSNTDDLLPISMDAFESKKTRSAKNTVGRLDDFKVSPDGQSAEITFETLTSDASEKVEANAVYVSPVFFPKWKDGGGNEYRDVITHLDIVNHPVDHGQGKAEPIACALRMGLAKPTRFAFGGDDDEVGDEVDDDDAGDGGDQTTDPADTAGAVTVSKVVEQLRKLQIVLPDDTNANNFLDRLNVALMTAAAIEGDDDMADENQPAETKVVEPGMATMSLEAKQALAFGERAHRKQVSSQLDELLKTGRCTPKEHEGQVAKVSAIKLSLDREGNPASSDVEHWIESRESVPAGTFWDDDEKLKRMSVAPHPDPVKFGMGDEPLTDEQAEKLADEILSK